MSVRFHQVDGAAGGDASMPRLGSVRASIPGSDSFLLRAGGECRRWWELRNQDALSSSDGPPGGADVTRESGESDIEDGEGERIAEVDCPRERNGNRKVGGVVPGSGLTF